MFQLSGFYCRVASSGMDLGSRLLGFGIRCRFGIWEFPKIRGTFLGGPYNLGTILGSPIFGNSHIHHEDSKSKSCSTAAKAPDTSPVSFASEALVLGLRAEGARIHG